MCNPGVQLPPTSASLLALSLSSDADIHGTKLILCPNSGTHRPAVLSLAVAEQVRLPGVL